MSKADLYAAKETNDEIDVLKLANEKLRVKVEQVRVQVDYENERMNEFNQNSREIIKREEALAKE